LILKDSEDGSSKWEKGPPCTDNFQIRRFTYQDVVWQSVEQAYQASKFRGEWRTKLQEAVPFGGETDSAYGMRVWQMGQRGRGMVLEWEGMKVESMYRLNVAKYAHNPDLCEELVATGTRRMKGAPSTWEWSKLNGLIQTLIRKQLREGVDLTTITGCTSEQLEEA